MKLVRLANLSVNFLPNHAVLVRAPSAGIAVKVPPIAIELLAFLGEPRSEEDVVQVFGEPGQYLFNALSQAGVLTDPVKANETPGFFDDFARLDVHHQMLSDKVRIDAYKAALMETVKPGMAVLDAGTGSGILACLAAQAGARVVYGVDGSNFIQVAEKIVKRSGMSDRIKLISEDFSKVELPEKVDLIVTETFGALALAEGSVDDLRACCERNLKPDGRVIPNGIDFWVAPVGDKAIYDKVVGVFDHFEGINLEYLKKASMHRGLTLDLEPDALLAPAENIINMEYPQRDYFTSRVSFSDLSEGELCGLAGWFTLKLSDNVTLPTGPSDPTTHWHQLFLPIEPTRVTAGSELTISMKAEPGAEDRRSLEVYTDWAVGEKSGHSFHRIR